ncbi:ABC transporter permease family protein [Roseitranquillus sediminis]|uniref:ABC transporter permease subunit n=1 Tax=Roseitranquillus sediminis TaxID=2809051 RepID=UPI001D0C6B98|nr:ABC transporter permease subunit [Roseitranquillus sediminis]MBM9593519.1 ABC transporter permease subunit [Roseitranquillus sediminis]
MSRTALPGVAAATLVAALVAATLVAVALRAEAAAQFGPADWAAIRFTVLQAVLSAVLSVGLAIPVARALARRRFPGRRLLITLLGAPFVLPVIVAILGLLAVFGQNGLVNAALAGIGLPGIRIYGLTGVVLAHVFFNLPLAVRLILQGWVGIPAERFRLAASLGFGPSDVARLLERPMLREVVPGALLVVFLLCTTSFAVALTLGGGPRATTIELAIYQAFRFDFDLGRAALLGLAQVALTATAALVALRSAVPAAFGAGLGAPVARWDARTPLLRVQDTILVALAAAFLLTPLLLVVTRGAAGIVTLPASVWLAAGRSVAVALGSTALMLILALSIAAATLRLGRTPARLIEASGYLAVAVSPMVLGTGLFLLLFPVAGPADLALPVTMLVNAVMSLPFALRALVPALAEIERSYGRLASSLDMHGQARLRHLWLPRLRRPLGFAAGLAAALSMGDLGVVALFADPEHATLPLKLYDLMGAYRSDAAAAAAVLLLALSLGAFWIFDRGGRIDADL